jgi:transposase
VIPPESNGEFVAAMEDVLSVYKRPRNEKRPLVCMDEQPTQLIKETRVPLPAIPGQPERYDYEYERNGTANNFMFTAPLEDWRKVSVRERKTKCDWAKEIRELVDVDFPQAEKIVLVLDNLNTHTAGALYEAFEPKEARRILDKLEIHYTPKHGSWLNMAEIELSVLTKQCLARRIPDIETLKAETLKWYTDRNAAAKRVDWQFTTENARVKLRRLYPQFQIC